MLFRSLPEDVDKESKENFFKFIRENQSKVLLVLDGLDEADPSKIPMFLKLVERREFSKCPVVLTSRHEVGVKFRRFCDTLWEIVGFTTEDAETFIIKYFKNNRPLAQKLLEQLSTWSGSGDLREVMSNPLNTALLCVICEDFEGNFPTSRTQLYIEIVLFVLRRYEKKNDLSRNSENLMTVYEEELIQLGHMALNSLREGELYIEESECGRRSNVLSKFGFLSVQAAGSRRKPCVRYRFLHKSFQEFFSGFFLASEILNGKLDCDTVVTDEEYSGELKQAFLFMSGIVVSRCEEKAIRLVKSIARHINAIKRKLIRNLQLGFDCIMECATHKKHIQSQLLRTFGSHLDIKDLELHGDLPENFEFFCEALTVNTTLTDLSLSNCQVGDSDSGSLSRAIKVNIALTHLDLSDNNIGASGAGFLSDAIKVNNVLTYLNLNGNKIGNCGAGFLADAIKVNTSLTNLKLCMNNIGNSGAGFLSDAIKVNTVLTDLDLMGNRIGDSGAGFFSDAFKVNTVLTNLDLSCNVFRASGTGSLSDADNSDNFDAGSFSDDNSEDFDAGSFSDDNSDGSDAGSFTDDNSDGSDAGSFSDDNSDSSDAGSFIDDNSDGSDAGSFSDAIEDDIYTH